MSGKRVVVIGGGITGLAAALHLVEESPECDITLLEAKERLGGVISTRNESGFLVEEGPENFITNVPWGLDFCRRVGFEDELIATTDKHRHAFVVRGDKLHKIPDGFLIMAPSRIGPILTTPILNWIGKIRMFAEYFVPRRKSDEDESLESFATRRFGKEAFQRLIQPLVGGIYTADPKKLSIRATMPRFVEMETRYGSLIRGVYKQAAQKKKQEDQKTTKDDQKTSGARYGMFVAARSGMSQLVDLVAARLGPERIRLNTKVARVSRCQSGEYEIEVNGSPDTLKADAVIVTTPAFLAAEMLEELVPAVADRLKDIEYTSCALVSLGYRREQIGHELNGFGYVTPQIEEREVLSSSFSSVKYEGRAPDGTVLVRVYIGGACQGHLVERSDEELLKIAKEELKELIQAEGEPVFSHITRQIKAMPQYHLGHQALVSEIQDLASTVPGLFLAGNAYHGVGIPLCIHGGEKSAEKAARWLESAQVKGSGVNCRLG